MSLEGQPFPRHFPLQFPSWPDYKICVERVVNKAKGFQAAADWDVEQQIRMTPQERWAVARRLKERVYGGKAKDVRACHQTR